MKTEKGIKQEGVVIEALPNTTFLVDIGKEKHVLARLSGKIRKHYIRILVGDTVTVEVSPYDLFKGRITYRGTLKENK